MLQNLFIIKKSEQGFVSGNLLNEVKSAFYFLHSPIQPEHLSFQEHLILNILTQSIRYQTEEMN